jgi:glutaryl-CoA dehydrogenase (non-decarboxylating)
VQFGAESETVAVQDEETLRAEFREFAERVLAPSIEDEFANETLNPVAIPELANAGFLGLSLPPQFGGRGLDYLALAMLCEELGRIDTCHQITVTVHLALAGLSVLQWGTPQQRRQWLPRLAVGESIATFALTEPNAGSDVGAMSATVRREGDDYVLNGEKAWISLSDVADLFIVFATLDRSMRHRGICAFIVERERPGLTTTTYHNKLGVRASNTGSVVMSEVCVGRSALLGREGEGFAIGLAALGNGLFTVGAGALGSAQAAFDAARSRVRSTGGDGSASAVSQSLQQLLAQMERDIRVARSLLYDAGRRKNRGDQNAQKTSLAKWQAAEAAFATCEAALQIYELTGLPPYAPVERHLRNVKGSVIYGGTREIHTTMQAAYARGDRFERPVRCPSPTAADLANWPLPDSNE